MSAWQPIETAPKDGTKILAYGRGTDEMMWSANKEMPFMMCVAWWYWHDSERLVDAGGGLFRKVPERALEMWKPIGPHFFRPTHWMPLPPPPQSDGKAQETSTVAPSHSPDGSPERQVGEPEAWRVQIGDSDNWGYCGNEDEADFYGKQSGLKYRKEPLYAAAPERVAVEKKQDV